MVLTYREIKRGISRFSKRILLLSTIIICILRLMNKKFIYEAHIVNVLVQRDKFFSFVPLFYCILHSNQTEIVALLIFLYKIFPFSEKISVNF